MSGRTEPAEVAAARALLAGFQHDMRERMAGGAPAGDWVVWALRLGQHLQNVLDAPGPVPARPGPEAPDTLAGLGQRAILRNAINDAIRFRDPRGDCPDCDRNPAGACDDHAGDLDRIDAYFALAQSLGLEAER